MTLRYGGQYVNDQKDGFGSFSVLPRFDDLFASRNPLEIHWKWGKHLFWDISSGFPMFECFIVWEICGNRCLTLLGGSRIAHPRREAESFMSLFWR